MKRNPKKAWSILKRLKAWVDSSNLLPVEQGGARKGRGSQHQIFLLHEVITNHKGAHCILGSSAGLMNVECSLCYEPYNGEERCPRLLKCGHTYCHSCLQQILKGDGSIDCPVDRQNNLVENRDLTMLQKNFALLSLVDSPINKPNCVQHKAPFILFCIQDKDLLCLQCVVGEHVGHPCMDLKVAAAQHREQAQMVQAKFESALEEAERLHSESRQMRSDRERDIRAWFAKMQAVLAEREQTLLQELDRSTPQLLELEAWRTQLQQGLAQAKEALQARRSEDLIQLTQKLKNPPRFSCGVDQEAAISALSQAGMLILETKTDAKKQAQNHLSTSEISSDSPVKLKIKIDGGRARKEGESSFNTPRVSMLSHNPSHATILIVGPSGTGKTTFLETLENIHYRAEAKIKSETLEVYTNQKLFRIAEQYCCVQFIDTPGFGNSGGRSNFELEKLILKFVKNNVRQLNMVLVCVPVGKRITKGQARDVLECMNFLGPELREITAILATHSEGKTAESKQAWFKEVEEENHTKRMIQFCQGGLFFTGMNANDNPIQQAAFEKFQQKSISRIIQKAYRNKPVKLTGEEFKKEASRFMAFESAAEDSLTLLRILPELKNKCTEAVLMRQQLVDLNEQVPEDKTDGYGKIMNRLKEISQEEVEKSVLEWCKYQTAVEKYVGEGNRLCDASNSACELYTQLNKALNDGRELLFDIRNLKEAASKPMYDEEAHDQFS
eukprot:g52026.t1